jgi:hypothetical protein
MRTIRRASSLRAHGTQLDMFPSSLVVPSDLQFELRTVAAHQSLDLAAMFGGLLQKVLRRSPSSAALQRRFGWEQRQRQSRIE